MWTLRFVAEFIEAVTFCQLSESYSAIIDMSAPDARIASLQAQVEECEARAERYRRALHISVGIANAPAPLSLPESIAYRTTATAKAKSVAKVATREALIAAHYAQDEREEAAERAARAAASAKFGEMLRAKDKYGRPRDIALGYLTIIDRKNLYLVKERNRLYEYDYKTGVVGDFVGHLTKDHTIDRSSAIQERLAYERDFPHAVAAEKAAASKASSKAPAKASTKAPAKAKSAKAPVVVAPFEVDGEFIMLDGELRFVRNGNVYEFDLMTEEIGSYLGRLAADGESINTSAAEVMKGKTSAPAPATAAKAPEPVEAEGELKMIAGEMYMVINGNVYEYDQMAETAGKFVGGLSPNGQYIDLKAAKRGGYRSRKTRALRLRLSKNRKTRSQNRRH
jgi:hypothetical protein